MGGEQYYTRCEKIITWINSWPNSPIIHLKIAVQQDWERLVAEFDLFFRIEEHIVYIYPAVLYLYNIIGPILLYEYNFKVLSRLFWIGEGFMGKCLMIHFCEQNLKSYVLAYYMLHNMDLCIVYRMRGKESKREIK